VEAPEVLIHVSDGTHSSMYEYVKLSLKGMQDLTTCHDTALKASGQALLFQCCLCLRLLRPISQERSIPPQSLNLVCLRLAVAVNDSLQ
jgi:hypothetical protein